MNLIDLNLIIKDKIFLILSVQMMKKKIENYEFIDEFSNKDK